MRLLKRLSCFALRVTATVVVTIGLALWYVTLPLAAPAAVDAPTFAVATERLQGVYRGAVMLVIPYSRGHIGLVLNLPTKAHLAEIFPEDVPSRQVVGPVYLGGFEMTEAIFAMSRAEKPRHETSIELMPGIWLDRTASVIDSIIAATPNAARYYAGLVIWPPGKLEDEVERGLLALRPADASKLFLPDTSNLYEQLRTRLEI
jgi:putative AlgH/UPF0301 family transcriptional regulator